MILAEMADALDSSPDTKMRWLHVKLRGKIAWRIKKDE